jgi:hypothetical protein
MWHGVGFHGLNFESLRLRRASAIIVEREFHLLGTDTDLLRHGAGRYRGHCPPLSRSRRGREVITQSRASRGSRQGAMGSGGPAVKHSHPYRALRNIYVNNMKVILVRNIHLLSPPVRVGPRSFVTVAWLKLRVIHL